MCEKTMLQLPGDLRDRLRLIETEIGDLKRNKGVGAAGGGDPPAERGGDEPRDVVPAEIFGEEIVLTPDMLLFWLDFFIASDVDGARTVPAGPRRGQRMINGPFTFSDCFITDNRTFSADILSSARVRAVALLDLSGAAPALRQKVSAGLSVELDCEDGDEEATGSADTVRTTYQDLKGTSDFFDLRLEMHANDPLFRSAPDVDAVGQISVIDKSILTFVGKIDDFPSFEAYVKRGGRPVRTVFQQGPKPGATPWSLFGSAARDVRAKVAL
jgi:hypothetical protein